MASDEPDDPDSDRPKPPVTSGAERIGGWVLVLAGYVCGVTAFVLVPVAFGTACIFFGIINFGRGERTHGWLQMALGVLGVVGGQAINGFMGWSA